MKINDNDELIILQNKVIAKVTKELADAYSRGKLLEFKKKYEIEEDKIEHYFYNETNFKILIIGDLAISKSVVYEIAKRYKINHKQLEFVEYEKVSRYNFKILQGTTAFSDVLAGPMPHKNNGIGAYSSFLSNVEKNPELFPKVIKLESNTQGGNLKITKSALIDAFEKTRGYSDQID